MKAAYYTEYGSPEVVAVRDIECPKIADTEILVKVGAASVTTADWRLRASAYPAYAWLAGRLMFGLFAPKNNVLGSDFAGRIAVIGNEVTRFKVGDEVFGASGNGAHAEFLKISEDGPVHLKPAGLDDMQAAAVPFGALSALVFLRDFAKIRPGQKVLIIGASGGVGVYAVQIARHFGAEVTGMCSTANLDLVRSLGADHVIDYTTKDFAKSGETYDLIVDTISKTSFAHCKPALTPNGIFLPIEFTMREIVQSLTTKLAGSKRVVVGISGDRLEDLTIIRDLLDAGVLRPVIDSQYPLSSIPEAHRRVESRHKTGSVIVTFPQDPDTSSGLEGRISALCSG